MASRFTATLAALTGLCTSLHANTVVLSDDFSGAALDAAKWTTVLPFGGSSLTQNGGAVTTQARGVLATANQYAEPYVISGAFTMLSDLEHFNVAFRTNLAGSDFGERQGMLVSFSNDGNQISIQRYTSAVNWNLLAVKNYTLVTGTTYFFSIFDDGTNVALAVNGIDELAASNAYATGGQIAFYSREFGNTATSIDAVTITHVPDGGSSLSMLGAPLVVLFAIRTGARRTVSIALSETKSC